ncbi:heterokaryon incompatibility protein-domain-containing protein [Lasiosphaeria ovina]|uniref:Heterokaryon incompatibility protein-domain-containing protein n=1 Tax=Lasiosphaeria ovina TaxID=92902 RepID=A0AAE0JUQ2_9PEZI|nr:heterokaryon incompatibility protein-domain-containing protein [Lasiosphaeria ovina]
MPEYGVSSHLTPFLPYIEKARSTSFSSDWRMPDSLSRPIEIGTLAKWLKTCDTHHNGHCQSQHFVNADQTPTWLVNVRRQCIERACPGHRYVALSYVWGKAESVSLTTTTVDSLLILGSLDNVVLPRTIRDAMHLVAALDLTHLWVDRLCIVQDDDAEKHAQIKAMGSIYAQSYFTLIAAQSFDASGQLSPRPLRRSPPPGWTGTLANPWRGPKSDKEVMKLMALDLLRTIWFSRGWTFQEFLFSRRKIIFHNNTVNWECHCTSTHETQQVLEEEPCQREAPQTSSLGVDIDPWPNFHRYARLAALFTPRHLTYAEDVLDAFAGASTAFARVYPGGLVTGLPAMVFDAALIWQPYHPLERRKPAVMSDEDAILPSWSWVSWRGNVHSESWQSGHDYIKRQTTQDSQEQHTVDNTWHTLSTLQWSHSASLNTSRFPITVEAAEWRKRFADSPAQALPSGWQKNAGPGCTDTYFTHSTLPGHDFSYPIPIGLSDGRAVRSRFLHATTRQARLRMLPKAYRAFASGCAVAGLQGPDGRLAGCLRLNDYEQNVRGNLPAEPCLLVELSAGVVELGHPAAADGDLLGHPLADVFDEWSIPSWEQKTGTYRFYNVMWVELKEGGVAGDSVACRLAVGRVDKAVWEAVATEEVQVTLG